MREIAKLIEAAKTFQPEPPANGLKSKSFTDYLRGYKPAESLLGGILQRGYVYALTASTGDGKTAVATTIALHLSAERAMCGHEPAAGIKILLLSGENDHDQQTRLIASCQQFEIEPADRLRVISGSYPIGSALDTLRNDAQAHGPYGLIIADTSIAFFGGDNENDNPQLRNHAAYFRELTKLPGNPTALILCHPTKNATRENLLPRGGGAFLNEIDGNLTLWREGERLTLHTAGKFRGAVFDPVHFRLMQIELAAHRDAKGRPIHSVVAIPIDEHEVETLSRQDWTDENRLLYEMLKNSNASISSWALACAWKSETGTPHKSKVHRLLESLSAEKLVRRSRGKWLLTPQGKTEAEKCV